MTTEALIAVVSGIVALAGALFSYRSATASNRTADRKVDLEAFEKAQVVSEKIIDRLQAQTDRLAAQVESVNERLAREMDTSHGLRNDVRSLRAQIEDLNQTVATLRAQLGPRH